MSKVSLIDGHIDDTKFTCKECTKRHYNCHSNCGDYLRRKQANWQVAVDSKSKREQEKLIERYEKTAFMRRGQFIKDRGNHHG